MAEERFMNLVKENNGFEFYQAFADDIDHILGGKDTTVWYTISKKGKVKETYTGKFQDGSWIDTYSKGSGVGAKTKAMPSGSTIKLIEEKAFLIQEEKWVKDRKPKLIEDSHPHFHYVYGFGDRAVDISEKYGVTIAYSDLKDPSAGFHLRYLYVGDEVEPL